MEIKCQLCATEVFIADLIACSTCFGHHYAHHQELKSIIQWLLLVVFGVVVSKLLVWCEAEGYVSGLQDANRTHNPLLGFCGSRRECDLLCCFRKFLIWVLAFASEASKSLPAVRPDVEILAVVTLC